MHVGLSRPIGASMRLRIGKGSNGRTGLPLCGNATSLKHARRRNRAELRGLWSMAIVAACRQRASAGLGGVPKALGAPCGCCLRGARRCLLFSAEVFVVSAFFVPRWRCCFAGWLSVPGRSFSSCAGVVCPLRAFCAGRASLVPGSERALSSASVFAFPAEVAARRRVCRRWLLAVGWPLGAGLVLSPSFAVPFPSVLSAAWRAGFPWSRFWSRLVALRRLR